MKELVLFAEVETSETLTAAPTAFAPGIWAYCLYATGEILPFMEDTFNRTPVNANNLVIDNEEYVRFYSLKSLYDENMLTKDRGCWVNDGSVIYVRFPFYNPPFLHFLFFFGTLMGFTNGKPLIKDGKMYKPGLLTTPQITHSADAFTYDRMKFNTANIAIDNSNGQFDDAKNLFGNEFNLKVAIVEEEKRRPEDFIKTIEEAGDEKAVSVMDTDEYIVLNKEGEKEKSELKMLAQYYIENISVTLNRAEFKLSDKRERLSAKIPDKQYTKDEFEYLNDNLDNKDMQEVYGRCFGVPGVCLEENRQFVDKTYITPLPQYRFRFSSQISRIDRIQVKMTAGEIPNKDLPKEMKTVDGWTTVYQRVAPDLNSLDYWKGIYPAWRQGVNYDPINDPAGVIDNPELLNQGIITLRWDIAKQGGERKNRINEVRIDGVFNNPKDRDIEHGEFVTPRDIIEDIMYKYANVPYDDMRYNIEEFKTELEKLENYEIGVMFDKSVSVYEAIEKLQGGSFMGFQFQVQGNLFTARVDDPYREKRKKSISHLEIININEVEVDWSADLYGTFTNIEYAYNYSEKKYQTWVDRERRQKILSIHRVDKECNIKTLLANEKDAKERSKNILDDFEELHPIIRNIKLSGEKWLGIENKDDELRIYDIIDIDFSIPGDEIYKYPQYLIKLIEEIGEDKIVSIEAGTDEYIIMSNDEKDAIGKRNFMRTITCKVLAIAPDENTGFVTIDVRVTKL
jgi:hypothetical protein